MGLFTPDMAFEVITRNQIEQLVSPALKCVDMVSSELLTVVKSCAEGVCESVLFAVRHDDYRNFFYVDEPLSPPT